MGGALEAPAIVLGGAVAVALIFASFWGNISKQATAYGSRFTRELEIAQVKLKSEELGFVVVGVSLGLWIALVLFLRPSPLVGTLLLVTVLGFSAYGAKVYIQSRVRRRTKLFHSQFEGVLRSLAGGIRAGLGLRQGLVHVSEHSQDPIRKELTRIAGAANLGVSVLDAFDELARRFPTPEAEMLARVVRVNAEAGGDLSSVLESLADTIRDRRRLDRKISSLTAHGRISAWVLGLLPVFVGTFILVTQAPMREATLTTNFGHIVLLVGVGLDAAAIFVLYQITRFEV